MQRKVKDMIHVFETKAKINQKTGLLREIKYTAMSKDWNNKYGTRLTKSSEQIQNDVHNWYW